MVVQIPSQAGTKYNKGKLKLGPPSKVHLICSFEDSNFTVFASSLSAVIEAETSRIGSIRKRMVPQPSPRFSASVARWLFFLFFLSFQITATATEVLPFERLGQAEGLSHNAVRCIFQDRAGFLWIGTESGLNRYDGTGFRVFRRADDEVGGIPGNAVQTIAEDRNGRLWVGLITSESSTAVGLCSYQPETGKFTPENRFLGISVFGIHSKKDGNLWLYSGKGLIEYDPIGNRMLGQYPLAHPSPPIPTAPSVAEDARGRVWFAGGSRLWYFDPVKKEIVYPVGGGIRTGSFPSCVLLRRDGRLWVGSTTGLYLVDTNADLPDLPAQPFAVAGKTVLSILEWENESFLIGLKGEGLAKIRGDRVEVCFSSPGNVPATAGNNPLGIFRDRGKTLWVGDQSQGLAKLSPSATRFRFFGHNPNRPDSLSDDFIRGIWRDESGTTWVGTQNAGLNALDPETGKSRRFQHDPNHPNSLPNDAVWTVLRDRRGVLWVGGEHYFGAFNPDTGTFRRLDQFSSEILVQTAYEDRAGNLWIPDKEKILRISPNRIETSSFRFDLKKLGKPHWGGIQAIHEDRRGTLWIAATNHVLRLNPTTGEQRFISAEGLFGPSIDPNLILTNFLEDRSGALWIVSKGAGMVAVDLETDRILRRLNTRTGLPNDYLYGAFQDRNGHLWLSSDNGIFSYDPVSAKVRRFNESDGIGGREFNRRAFFQSRNGEICFGGTHGLNIFSPDQISISDFDPPVLLTGARTATNPMALPANDQGEIEIGPSDTSISLSYAALDFASLQNNRYRVKLEGIDRDWRDVGNKTEIEYPLLPAGSYEFRVVGSNHDGIFGTHGAKLRIRVRAPWWRTAPAFVGYGLCFLAVAFSLYRADRFRLRLRNEARLAELRAAIAKKEQEVATERLNKKEVEAAALERQNQLQLEANHQLEELDRVKQHFAAMLVHDIKSPLAGATGLFQILEAGHLGQNPELAELAAMARGNLGKVVKLVEEVLQVYRSDVRELEIASIRFPPVDCLLQAYHSAYLAGRAKGITVALDLEPDLPEIEGDPNLLDRVFSNLLSNAVKFTPENGTVILRAESREGREVETGQHLLLVTITDTGPGIAPEEIPYVFDPYQQSKSLRETGESIGVGLGLAIVKQIVAAHGGNVSVRSQLGVGSSFSVVLPFSKKTAFHA